MQPHATLGGVAVVLAGLIAAPPQLAAADGSPEIRTSESNVVPACATPERLMAFLKTRNPRLDGRFDTIAAWYKHYGEAWRVRWDYAFFQMAIETNFLSYRQGNGRWGDVDPKQNNFAGIGTTGGGVPGDRFPDVKTGVLAQIQHLVAYSGERVAEPVAKRTRLRQDDIIEVSRKLNRPVLFSDLSRRWAVDRRYGRSIEWVAERFRSAYCREDRQELAAAPTPATREKLPWTVAAAIPARSPKTAKRGAPAPAAAPVAGAEEPVVAAEGSERCEIMSASYGGVKTLLIRSAGVALVRYTALTVMDGFEESMAANYIRVHAPGGANVGTFATRDDALAKARELCPKA